VRRNAAAVSKASGRRPGAVHEVAVQTFLARAGGPFDLVFTDPPYDIDDAVMTADLVALAPLLSADAVVVIERARRSTPPELTAAGLRLFREKTYGDTTLWWAEPTPHDEDAARPDQPETESQSR
jgi:16S rRNA (guanine966-N2)-methyltransferase